MEDSYGLHSSPALSRICEEFSRKPLCPEASDKLQSTRPAWNHLGVLFSWGLLAMP
jgi:hypothetical protein